MHLAKAQRQAGDHFPSPASKKVFPGRCQPRIYFTSLNTVARRSLDFSANMRTKYCQIQKKLHSLTYQCFKWFGKKIFFNQTQFKLWLFCKIFVHLATVYIGKSIDSPASVNSKILFITPAKMSFPGQQEASPAFTARQHNFPRQVQQPGAVVCPQKQNSPASVIAKEALSYRQDCRCSCKSVPLTVVRPGKQIVPSLTLSFC